LVLSDLQTQPSHPPGVARAASGPLITAAAPCHTCRLKTVMLTSVNSYKVPRMLGAWDERNIGELTVVVEHPAEKPAVARLQRRLRDEGLSWIGPRLRMTKSEPGLTGPVARLPDVLTYCRSRGIAVVETGPLDSADAITAVKELAPDLGIHAGAGILRQRLIDCFRLGVLNAHMGLLPDFRGVSVSEWAALHGAPVGCTVHWIDSGVDTGPILARREVEISACTTVAALFDAVDRAQMALLGEIVDLLVQGKALKPLDISRPPGPQFFRMHDDLAAILEARLQGSCQSWAGTSIRE
jgi:methionyl-tRNA formyltransferase